MLTCEVCGVQVLDKDLSVIEHNKAGSLVCGECEETVRENPEQYLNK